MAANKYKSAEDAYFTLRGQFDTGRITQEQFDDKLRDLMIQDEQGRYWMLGADSGKWYYYDGANWVPGEPPIDAAPAADAAAVAAAVPPASSAPAPVDTPAATGVAPKPTPPVPPQKEGREFPLVPIIIAVALLVGAVAAFLLFQNRDRIFVAQQPTQITPVLPPTITRAPSPTPLNVQATAVAGVTGEPTPIPVTVAPPSGLPTLAPATSQATTEPTNGLPTLLPTTTVVVTGSIPTVTPFPATETPEAPTSTPTPNAPPGVYVTGLTISPNPAKQNQAATFTATFLNTTGGVQSYNWLVLTYRAETGNQFGESTAYLVEIPVGGSTLSLEHVPVTGRGGGCESFFARAGSKTSSVEKTVFPNTSGAPATVNYESCPQ